MRTPRTWPMLLLSANLVLLTIPAQAENAQPDQQSDALCKQIARKLASVGLNECRAQHLKPTGAASVLGKPILMREYPPVKYKQPLGRVLFIGGVHGDEYSSVSVTFKWMNILNKHHSGLFHWRFIPLMNPDGLLRKKSRRINANGVDINRNFPTQSWDEALNDYWTRRTGRNTRRYPGPYALSEPETRWLVEEIARFRPDVIISVHAPHGLVDFDGPPKAPIKLGSLRLKVLGTYPGSLGNYAVAHKELQVVTLELSYAGIMPKKRQINRIWSDLIVWLKKNAVNRSAAPILLTDIVQTPPS